MTQQENGQERPRRRRRSQTQEDQPAAEAEAGQGEHQPSNGKAPEPSPPPRLLQRLHDEIGPQMTEEFSYKSTMQIPYLDKVVLNIGLGEALLNARAMEAATGDLTMISGQKPVITRAKKSIAGFKIREGMAIGVSVTLRGRRMYEFMDRLLNSALPRIRDFQGVPRDSFDGRGNFSLGIREQVIFPEIDYNNIDRIRGLQVAIVTTARNDQEGFRLLELLGMPFARTRDSLVA
jgi:large subunit ribosomal protein L5|tara:strand:- start:1708 stop:2409 length:702 start_codon:yes stop_codon:yes gene_type:complete